ncbi:hypothetical protein [Kineosporia sp. R_H_3]|uniref:hypothetical protein n=1 Tax=Kineosporia sp. R_H_3 TaxID=1961848 RepID=UPI0013040977|nr:hypothetical protein [Kineosporia sp. R_H_3]
MATTQPTTTTLARTTAGAALTMPRTWASRVARLAWHEPVHVASLRPAAGTPAGRRR